MSDPSERVPSEIREPEEVLTVTLNHTMPIELSDLSASLGALARQHQRFADRIGASINGDRVRLYVKEIRPGSMIVELLALAQTVAPILGAVNTIVPFARNVADLLSFAVGKETAPPEETTTKDARDLSDFIKPVAGDLGSSMVIHARDNARVEVNVRINSNEANAAQNRLNNWAARQQEPVSGIHEHQLFYFARATGEAQRATGDRGIIERFGKQAVRTRFMTPEAKQLPLQEPLFQKVYDVDVDVQTVDGKPMLYRILKVHDSFDRNAGLDGQASQASG